MPRVAVAAALVIGSLSLSSGASAQAARENVVASHPLVGTAWSAEDARPLSEGEYRARLIEPQVLLLGEIHDNPAHHRLQAEAIAALADAGRDPAIVFEMIPADFAGRLQAQLASAPDDAAALGAALEWEARGWPDWRIYEPIARVALDANLDILPGDLPGETVRSLSSEGLAALPAEEQARLGLDVPLAAGDAARLAETLRAAHCDLLPEAAIAPMQAVQRARDGALARAIVEAPGSNRVLIAGAGHVRRDWGVPAILARLAPELETLSVAFVEVEAGKTDPAAYLPEADGAEPVYDLLVFTERTAREDPCAALRQRMPLAARP